MHPLLVPLDYALLSALVHLPLAIAGTATLLAMVIFAQGVRTGVRAVVGRWRRR